MVYGFIYSLKYRSVLDIVNILTVLLGKPCYLVFRFRLDQTVMGDMFYEDAYDACGVEFPPDEKISASITDSIAAGFSPGDNFSQGGGSFSPSGNCSLSGCLSPGSHAFTEDLTQFSSSAVEYPGQSPLQQPQFCPGSDIPQNSSCKYRPRICQEFQHGEITLTIVLAQRIHRLFLFPDYNSCCEPSIDYTGNEQSHGTFVQCEQHSQSFNWFPQGKQCH